MLTSLTPKPSLIFNRKMVISLLSLSCFFACSEHDSNRADDHYHGYADEYSTLDQSAGTHYVVQ